MLCTSPCVITLAIPTHIPATVIAVEALFTFIPTHMPAHIPNQHV